MGSRRGGSPGRAGAAIPPQDKVEAARARARATPIPPALMLAARAPRQARARAGDS